MDEADDELKKVFNNAEDAKKFLLKIDPEKRIPDTEEAIRNISDNLKALHDNKEDR